MPSTYTAAVTNNYGLLSRLSATSIALSSIGDLLDPDKLVLKLSIPTADDLEEVGALFAALSNPPDTIFLDGDLGAGKTTFSRGFISYKVGGDQGEGPAVKVTSPTYLLSNTYCYHDEITAKTEEIRHMDLYRLSGTSSSDFDSLQLEHVFDRCISLIEWSTRLHMQPHLLPSQTNRLDVDIQTIPNSDTRVMTLQATVCSTWNDRLQSLLEEGIIDDLLLSVSANDNSKND